MPPKSKLHKSTGKIKSLPKPQAEENQPELQLSPEAIQQFELELCWCIQQLQTGLKSGKLNPKQVQDHTKALNALMSNSTSIVKKRQVMRLSFGDYRAKMAVENNKSNTAGSKIKISQGSPSKKSVFLKKAAFIASDNTFKFNFAAPTEDNLTGEMSNVKIECEPMQNIDGNFKFEPSSNSFRFNFATNE
ncbi:hypothetical protein MML48_1g13869 [Holotrichia oblita]|uniref:Uncharacterized protein n=1 Tax=Holotrichia oblita TaxID=644536 RepID=A0ACB9TZ87_HOLOL|nr:hypothetical protein MML48_1g13869 [Holotrichia oblita]